MNRQHSHLHTARNIIESFEGQEPLSSFLKKFFATDKKYGSKDRKEISHLCYCFFRLGKSALNLTVEERIITGLFLVSNEPNETLGALRPEWNEKASLTIEEKEIFLSNDHPLDPEDLFVLDKVFPWADQLSAGISHVPFCRSFFVQPYVYVRIRPGLGNDIISRLHQKKTEFLRINNSCLAFSPNSKLQYSIELDSEAVVQDMNSQFAGNRISDVKKDEPLLWDCCAASGGKSIQAYDLLHEPEIVASDVRESIISSLHERFKRAGVKNYKTFIADLSKPDTVIPDPFNDKKFDLIICDAPCTGSGTWSRTPEQLYFFNEEKISYYSNLQMSIVKNIVPYLKKEGKLLYITCSVFKKENEDVISFLTENSILKVEKMEILKGYDKKADTMFAALLTA